MNFHIFYFFFLCINCFFFFFSFFCLDVSKTTCSWSLTFSVIWGSSLYWSTWSQLIQSGFLFSTSGSVFSQWLYFPVDLGCVLIIFLVFRSSPPFILYSTMLPLLGFLLLSFTSSPLIWRLLLCCPLSSSSKISFILVLTFLFPLIVGLPNSLFAFTKWHGCIM